MRNNCVIIATNAVCFASLLQEKLLDADLRAFIASTDDELTMKIKTMFPRFIFIEHCFYGHGTDSYIQRMVKHDRSVRIVVWTVYDVKPNTAARYIAAGAESFFSLRETCKNIETIIYRIAGGQAYCSADVEAALSMECAYPVVGEELTEREKEIIKHSVDGKTNQQIADVLALTISAVKFHKCNIYRKCGGNTPVDILRNGIIKGIIHAEDLY